MLASKSFDTNINKTPFFLANSINAHLRLRLPRNFLYNAFSVLVLRNNGQIPLLKFTENIDI